MINKKASSVAAYVPGEFLKDNDGYIKLNTNENPYPPTPAAFVGTEDLLRLRLYSDPYSFELKSAISKLHNVEVENVFVGNGSDEVLSLICQTVFEPCPEKPVASLDITYSFYPVYADMYGFDYLKVPLCKDFTIDVKALAESKSQAIIFANPNAPTGIALPLRDIEYLLSFDKTKPVIVDEAYVDFGGESADGLLKKYENLIITRTLSKSYSLAGLRVGYALASKEVVDGLERIKNCFNSYTMDSLAQKIALTAIQDQDYMKKNAQKIIEARESFSKSLKQLDFKVLDSKANFVFASHKNVAAQQIFEYLKQNKILVRYFKSPRINNYLRITIGTKEQCSSLIQALDGLLNA